MKRNKGLPGIWLGGSVAFDGLVVSSSDTSLAARANENTCSSKW